MKNIILFMLISLGLHATAIVTVKNYNDKIFELELRNEELLEEVSHWKHRACNHKHTECPNEH